MTVDTREVVRRPVQLPKSRRVVAWNRTATRMRKINGSGRYLGWIWRRGRRRVQDVPSLQFAEMDGWWGHILAQGTLNELQDQGAEATRLHSHPTGSITGLRPACIAVLL